MTTPILRGGPDCCALTEVRPARAPPESNKMNWRRFMRHHPINTAEEGRQTPNMKQYSKQRHVCFGSVADIPDCPAPRSALPLKADTSVAPSRVRYGPTADSCTA